jgi:hypothetical protein
MRLILSCLLLLATAAPLFAQDRDEAAHRRIEAQLRATRIPVLAYEEADVTQVVRDIARAARVTIVFDRRALADVPEERRRVTLELQDLRADQALNLVLMDTGLHLAYRAGVLHVTTRERVQQATILRIYDIRDLTARVRDFPAPRIRLRDSNDPGPVIDIPQENDRAVDADDVVDMIETTIDADWGGTCTVRISRGQLVVRAPRDVQREVAALLGQLRASR